MRCILFGPLYAAPQTAPSPLRGEGRGEGERGGESSITLSPTPLPSRERGFTSKTFEPPAQNNEGQP